MATIGLFPRCVTMAGFIAFAYMLLTAVRSKCITQRQKELPDWYAKRGDHVSPTRQMIHGFRPGNQRRVSRQRHFAVITHCGNCVRQQKTGAA